MRKEKGKERGTYVELYNGRLGRRGNKQCRENRDRYRWKEKQKLGIKRLNRRWWYSVKKRKRRARGKGLDQSQRFDGIKRADSLPNFQSLLFSSFPVSYNAEISISARSVPFVAVRVEEKRVRGL